MFQLKSVHDHIVNKSFLNCSQEKFDLIESVRDVMIQEIMNIEKSEFEGEAVDMDNIAFASKLSFKNCGG